MYITIFSFFFLVHIYEIKYTKGESVCGGFQTVK